MGFGSHHCSDSSLSWVDRSSNTPVQMTEEEDVLVIDQYIPNGEEYYDTIMAFFFRHCISPSSRGDWEKRDLAQFTRWLNITRRMKYVYSKEQKKRYQIKRRETYMINKLIIVECECGKKVKKTLLCKHMKSEDHYAEMRNYDTSHDN
jgi:hypothetical protein